MAKQGWGRSMRYYFLGLGGFFFLIFIYSYFELGAISVFRLSWRHSFYEFCLFFLLFYVGFGGNVEKWGPKPPPLSSATLEFLKLEFLKIHFFTFGNFSWCHIISLIGTILLIMLSTLYRWRNWGPARFNNLRDITQLESGRHDH